MIFCPPDCPDRSPTCHCTCEKYKQACEKNERRKKLERDDNQVCAYFRKNVSRNLDIQAKKQKNRSGLTGWRRGN